MQLLKDRIRSEGKVLPGNIIKVDGFLNHRVDTRLMGQIADEFARLFDVENITMVLTAEASGIAPGHHLRRALQRAHGLRQEGQERQHRGAASIRARSSPTPTRRR